MLSSKHIALLVTAGFLSFASSYGKSQNNTGVTEDMQRSQFCARAAKEFRKRPEQKDADPLAQSTTFTSHFNKSMKKCLVQVVSVVSATSGGFIVFSHTYDALDGTILGGKTITKKRAVDDDKNDLVVMVRNGKFLKDKSEAAEAYFWYDTLMTD